MLVCYKHVTLNAFSPSGKNIMLVLNIQWRRQDLV